MNANLSEQITSNPKISSPENHSSKIFLGLFGIFLIILLIEGVILVYLKFRKTSKQTEKVVSQLQDSHYLSPSPSNSDDTQEHSQIDGVIEAITDDSIILKTIKDPIGREKITIRLTDETLILGVKDFAKVDKESLKIGDKLIISEVFIRGQGINNLTNYKYIFLER